MELIYGIHPVRLAMAAKRRKLAQLFVKKNKLSTAVKKIVDVANCENLPVKYLTVDALNHVTKGAVHQGVCVKGEKLSFETLSSVVEERDDLKSRLWVVLDKIYDPMNFGAILRTCYFMGVDRIFTTGFETCKLTPVVSKASSGVMEITKVFQIDQVEHFLNSRKKVGFNIVGSVGHTDANFYKVDVHQYDFKKSTILVLGSEGAGITNGVLNCCDEFLTISPTHNLVAEVDSLNVSVATGVILHCLSNKRKCS